MWNPHAEQGHIDKVRGAFLGPCGPWSGSASALQFASPKPSIGCSIGRWSDHRPIFDPPLEVSCLILADLLHAAENLSDGSNCWAIDILSKGYLWISVYYMLRC